MSTHPSQHTSENLAYGLYLTGLFVSFLLAYLATMVFVHNSKMMFLDREYSLWLHVKQVITSASRSPQDLIVIGDSRAKSGYIPHLTARRTMNLALAGQTPIEGYYLLANYLRNNPAPARLVVSYAPFHLGVADGFWDMTVKYDFLSSEEYREVMDTSSRLDDKLLGEKDRRWQYLFLPSTYLDSMRRAIKEKRWHTNQDTYTQVADSHGHHYYGTEPGATDLNQEIQKGKFVKSNLLDFYLKKLIDLAQSNHVQVFWYTMPFSEVSCKNLPTSFKTDFQGYLSDLESRMGMKVIETISCLPNALFGDSNHLYLGATSTTLAILNAVSPPLFNNVLSIGERGALQVKTPSLQPSAKRANEAVPHGFTRLSEGDLRPPLVSPILGGARFEFRPFARPGA